MGPALPLGAWFALTCLLLQLWDNPEFVNPHPLLDGMPFRNDEPLLSLAPTIDTRVYLELPLKKALSTMSDDFWKAKEQFKRLQKRLKAEKVVTNSPKLEQHVEWLFQRIKPGGYLVYGGMDSTTRMAVEKVAKLRLLQLPRGRPTERQIKIPIIQKA